jgi:EAL domain-containing protein (putative c-di-GMP-specific phosphodiesterase class I)
MPISPVFDRRPVPASSTGTNPAEFRQAQALREAVRSGRINVALQPKVTLSTGKLAGVDALARWTMSDGTMMQPRSFVALAERHHLLSALGERVLDTALDVLADWRDRGLPLVPVAVNFLSHEFDHTDIAARVANALRTRSLPAGLLELELTESMLMGKVDSALRSLQSLRDLGVSMSVEEFGTGSTWATYLARFAIYRVKIARSLVRSVAHDASVRDIVESVIRLAHRMGHRCVADGIETEEQLALLQELGCDEGLGFAVACPMSASEMAEWLQRESIWQPLSMPGPLHGASTGQFEAARPMR